MTATLARARQRLAGPRRQTVVRFIAATAAMYLAGSAFLLEHQAGEMGSWAALSDVGALLFGASLVPLVREVGFGRWTSRLGLASAALVTGGSAWLLLASIWPMGAAGGAGLAAQMAGLGALGAWLLAVGRGTLRTRRWSRVAGWAAVVGGTGYVVGAVAAALQAFTSPVFFFSYVAGIVGGITWAACLIREEHVHDES
jgi:hypothetical protein